MLQKLEKLIFKTECWNTELMDPQSTNVTSQDALAHRKFTKINSNQRFHSSIRQINVLQRGAFHLARFNDDEFRSLPRTKHLCQTDEIRTRSCLMTSPVHDAMLSTHWLPWLHQRHCHGDVVHTEHLSNVYTNATSVQVQNFYQYKDRYTNYHTKRVGLHTKITIARCKFQTFDDHEINQYKKLSYRWQTARRQIGRILRRLPALLRFDAVNERNQLELSASYLVWDNGMDGLQSGKGRMTATQTFRHSTSTWHTQTATWHTHVTHTDSHVTHTRDTHRQPRAQYINVTHTDSHVTHTRDTHRQPRAQYINVTHTDSHVATTNSTVNTVHSKRQNGKDTLQIFSKRHWRLHLSTMHIYY